LFTGVAADVNRGGSRKSESPLEAGSACYPGDDLLSHTVSRAVPSALKGLTAVFGKGTGVSPSL
jgi:hypothetical protein